VLPKTAVTPTASCDTSPLLVAVMVMMRMRRLMTPTEPAVAAAVGERLQRQCLSTMWASRARRTFHSVAIRLIGLSCARRLGGGRATGAASPALPSSGVTGAAHELSAIIEDTYVAADPKRIHTHREIAGFKCWTARALSTPLCVVSRHAAATHQDRRALGRPKAWEGSRVANEPRRGLARPAWTLPAPPRGSEGKRVEVSRCVGAWCCVQRIVTVGQGVWFDLVPAPPKWPQPPRTPWVVHLY
jgi:hypothetical protein